MSRAGACHCRLVVENIGQFPLLLGPVVDVHVEHSGIQRRFPRRRGNATGGNTTGACTGAGGGIRFVIVTIITVVGTDTVSVT